MFYFTRNIQIKQRWKPVMCKLFRKPLFIQPRTGMNFRVDDNFNVQNQTAWGDDLLVRVEERYLAGTRAMRRPQDCAATAVASLSAHRGLSRLKKMAAEDKRGEATRAQHEQKGNSYQNLVKCYTTPNTHTHRHTQAGTHTHAGMHVCMHAHKHTRTHTHIHTCRHARTHASTHVCMHTHTRTHTHTHTHTHKQ